MNLFKTALLAVVCVAAASTPSLAAKSTGWGGAYAGLSVGYLQDQSNLTDIDDLFIDGSTNPDSANNMEFGAQAGYNWQEGRTVYGLEADAFGVYGESTQGFKDGGEDLYVAQTINGSYSARARIGLTMDNDYMVYATGGIAALQTESYSHSYGSDRDGMGRLFFGWTSGLGVEKKLNSTYSAKLEGRYSDYAEKAWFDSGDDRFGSDPETFAISAGVNYHF